MNQEERNKLETTDCRYFCIGITENGEKRGSIPVPWELTIHAFNMKIPNLYLAPEDLHDKDLMEKIKSFHVIGIYIFTRLDDYSFISMFPDVYDIYILDGINLKDLSFLRTLNEWQMLHLGNARLNDLEPIYASYLLAPRRRRFCLSFAGTAVEDVSALYKIDRISELIVVGKDDDTEREKWGKVSASTYRYYSKQ